MSGSCLYKWLFGTENFRGFRETHARGPFLESPDNFSGPESYFVCTIFTLKTQVLLVSKAEQ